MKELIWRSAPREVKRWVTISTAPSLRVGTERDFKGGGGGNLTEGELRLTVYNVL